MVKNNLRDWLEFFSDNLKRSVYLYIESLKVIAEFIKHLVKRLRKGGAEVMKLGNFVKNFWFYASCFYDDAKVWLLISLCWLAAMAIAKIIGAFQYDYQITAKKFIGHFAGLKRTLTDYKEKEPPILPPGGEADKLTKISDDNFFNNHN